MICKICKKEFNFDWRISKKSIRRNKIPLFCSLECSNSRVASIEANKIRSLKLKKNQDKFCISCQKLISFKNKSGYCIQCLYKSDYFKMRISYSCKGISGGYREKSGRGISGYYKGFYVSSTWELAYIIFLIDHNIPFERNLKKFKYFDKENKTRNYIPDFIVKGKFIEVKGPQDRNWNEKIKQFQEELVVIDRESVQFYIDYVKETYKVKDLKLLYDNQEIRYCSICNIILSKRNISGYCRKHFQMAH